MKIRIIPRTIGDVVVGLCYWGLLVMFFYGVFMFAYWQLDLLSNMAIWGTSERVLLLLGLGVLLVVAFVAGNELD